MPSLTFGVQSVGYGGGNTDYTTRASEDERNLSASCMWLGYSEYLAKIPREPLQSFRVVYEASPLWKREQTAWAT